MKSNSSKPKKYGLDLSVIGEETHRGESRQAESFAQIGRQITFDPTSLETYHYEGWKPAHHDLLLVCAAVEFADRRCARRRAQWARDFSLTVPVSDSRNWQRHEVQERLSGVLRQLTGDQWRFHFVQGSRTDVHYNPQRALPFGSNKQFAIAYSDGLDSRCVSGLYEKNDNAIRVRVTKTKEKVKKGERPFDRVPFNVNPKRSPESSVRSRGFKFAAITAIAAHLSGVENIVVPESGQGALGPVLLPLHNIYPDYRNHPVFFRKMEQFIKALLGYSVIYEQPRIWHTKGQTISAFLAEPGTSPETIVATRSCWQQRWNTKFGGKLHQCGLCAACLLRRMSMHAAGVAEPADAYTISDLSVDDFNVAVPKRNDLRLSATIVDYGSIGARHLKQFADLASLTDAQLRPEAFEIARATGASEQLTLQSLRELLVQHKDEWRDFLSAQGNKSFINRWIGGGRYGRSE